MKSIYVNVEYIPLKGLLFSMQMILFVTILTLGSIYLMASFSALCCAFSVECNAIGTVALECVLIHIYSHEHEAKSTHIFCLLSTAR